MKKTLRFTSAALTLALILPHFIGVWGIYAAEAVSNPLTTIITFAVFERYMRTLKARMA